MAFVAFWRIKKLALLFVLLLNVFLRRPFRLICLKKKLRLGEKATFRVTINGLEGKDVISKPKMNSCLFI